MRIFIFCVLSFYILASYAFAKDLPATFPRCRRKDPKFDKCLTNAVNEALRQMKNGMPQYGILPIDPLVVDSLLIEQGGSSPINIKQQFKNVKLHHLSESNVTKYDNNLDKYMMKGEAYTPMMQFIGDYTMDGRILLLPISGKGVSNVTMHKLLTKHELIGEPIKKNGEIYMKIKKYKIKFEPEFVTMDFENLFNGDKALGEGMNKFLNENWQIVFQELRGGYEDTFGYIFKEITNKLFLKVPMNKIFLED